MLNKHAVSTSDASRALGSYSQALSVGNLIFITG